MNQNHYDVLGVDRDATEQEIRQAFRRKAAECHPDRHNGDKSKEEQFKALAIAKTILLDPRRRALYDAGQEDSIDDVYREALQVVHNGFFQIVDSIQNTVEVDVIGKLKQGIMGKKRELVASISKIEQDIKKMKRVKRRIVRKKKGRNIFADAVDKRIDEYQRTIENIQHGIEVLNTAYRICKEYEYRCEDAGEGMHRYNAFMWSLFGGMDHSTTTAGV